MKVGNERRYWLTLAIGTAATIGLCAVAAWPFIAYYQAVTHHVLPASAVLF